MAKAEVKAGVFTLVALGILSLFIVLISGFSLWHHETTYRTRFQLAIGISSNTPVRMNGVTVGKVDDVKLLDDNTQVEVTFGLDDGIELREGVKAEIATSGLIGDTFLLLTQKKAGGKVLPPDSLIPSVEKMGLAETLGSVGKLASKASDTLDNLSARAESILASIQVVANKERMQALDDDIALWQKQINQFLANMAAISNELSRTIDQVDTFMGQANSAIAEDQTYVRETLVTIRDRVQELGATWGQISDRIDAAVETDQTKVASILDKGDKVMDQVDHIAGRAVRAADISLEDLVTMTNNLAEASRNLLVLSERVREDPSLVIRPAQSRQ